MKIDDYYIIKTFYSKSGRMKSVKNLSSDVYHYLKNRYNDIPEDLFSFYEVIWRIKNNTEIRPVCKNCGRPVKFIKRQKCPYPDHCCRSCAKIDPKVQSKYELTCLLKYGVSNSSKSTEVQSKYKSTCLLKYGTTNPNKSSKIREKYKKTCIEKYGVDNTTKVPGISNKIQNSRKTNNTCNKSKIEDFLYEALTEKYNNVLRQYKSEKYPYMCDFYIPSIDTYIEYNGFITHKDRPFDPLNETDLNEKQILYEKSKLSKFYKNIYNIWINKDPEKIEISVKNNIKIIFIYNTWLRTHIGSGFLKTGKTDLKLLSNIIENEIKTLSGPLILK